MPVTIPRRELLALTWRQAHLRFECDMITREVLYAYREEWEKTWGPFDPTNKCHEVRTAIRRGVYR